MVLPKWKMPRKYLQLSSKLNRTENCLLLGPSSHDPPKKSDYFHTKSGIIWSAIISSSCRFLPPNLIFAQTSLVFARYLISIKYAEDSEWHFLLFISLYSRLIAFSAEILHLQYRIFHLILLHLSQFLLNLLFSFLHIIILSCFAHLLSILKLHYLSCFYDKRTPLWLENQH